MTQTAPGKIEYLDGLRGIAALVVVLAHFKELLLPGTSWATHLQFESVVEKSPLMLLFVSHLSVLIFFVHSGFVLSWKYLNVPDARILISMAARRGFRLGIPIAASIMFAFCLMRLGLMQNAEVAEVSGSKQFFSDFYNFYPPPFTTALKDSFGGALLYGSFRYNGALWTMPIELICSYIVFAILPLIVGVRIKHLVLLILLASLTLLQHYPWLICFLAGILLVRLYQDRFFDGGLISQVLRFHKFLPSILLIVAAALALYPNWMGKHIPIPEFLNPSETVQIISAILIVTLVMASGKIQAVLRSRLAQFLGRLSFSAYLLHLPIICSFSSWLFLALRAAGVSYGFAIILDLFATIPVIYLISWVMTLTIDSWAINFGKKTLQQYLYSNRNNDMTLSNSAFPMSVSATEVNS